MSESDQSDPDHYSTIDPEYLQIYTPVYLVTTAISLIANIMVIGFHWIMTWHKIAEFNRVSLRLIVFATCIGAFRSIIRFAMGVPANTAACLVESFFLGWTEIAAPLCLGMVGVHAVCVLVLNVKNPLRQEKYYYMIIVTYSVVTNLVAITHRTIHYPEDFHCWVRFYFGSKASRPFSWIWYFTLLLLPMTLAAICSLILAIRYRMERHNFVETSVRYAQNNNPYLLPAIPNRRRRVDPIKTFRNLVIRSAFYALVPVITKIFLVVSGLTSLRGYSTNFYALIIGGIITNLQGLLISILYFSDPAVTFTLGRLGRFLRRVYVDEYHLPEKKPTDDSDQMEMGVFDINDLEDGNGSEDDIGGAIRLAHDKLDMVVADTSAMEPTHELYHHNGRHYWKHQYGHQPQGLPPYYQRVKVDTTKRMQDPYRYRWLAKTIHFFLTFICRLKPLPPTSDSTSTLSFHSRTLSRVSTSVTQISSICGIQSLGEDESTANRNNSVSTSSIITNHLSSTTTKEHVPAIRFDMVAPKDTKKQTGKQKTSTVHISNDSQQLLAIPTKTGTTSKPSVSPHDSLPSSSSFSSSGVSDDSDAKVRGIGKPIASSKLAQQSKKLRQVMLHRPENIHIFSDWQQQQKVSPPISTLQHTPPEQTFLQSTSHHLSPSSSEEDIDRLSLLSTELPANEQYEPLSAPPHYYQHRRQQGQQQQQQQQQDKKTIPTTTLPTPRFSITLADQDQTIDRIPISSSSSPSSSFISALSPTTTGMELLAPLVSQQLQQDPGLKHGVPLAPAVLKTLLDWGPRNTTYPAYVDQLIMDSDGLGYGCTNVIHIQQSWYLTTDGITRKDNGSSTLDIGDGGDSIDNDSMIGDSISNSGSSNSRLVFFVEHWVKGYLGSRWFVVE